MATFTGNFSANTANATSGTINGFTVTGGSGIDIDDLQDGVGDEFLADSGSDTIVAGAGDDTITGGADADEMHGGDGNDWFDINTGDIKAGEIIDGGTGATSIDRIRVAGSAELYLATITSIETIQFLNTLGAATATFAASQTAGGALSTSLGVRGSDAADTLVFDMGLSNTLNLASYSWSAWTPGTDQIVVNMDASSETIIGSIQNDRFVSVGAFDTVEGGDGDDTFKLVNGPLANRVIGGGTGSDDRLEVTSGADFASGLYDLRFSVITGIERIDLKQGAGDQTILIIMASQFYNGSELAHNLHINGAVGTTQSRLQVVMGGNTTLDLSGLTFSGAPLYLVQVFGDSDSEAIVGSTHVDYVTGGAGNDTLTGGGGADLLYGDDGDDTFRVSAGDVAAGELFDGGAAVGTSDRILTTGSVDLQDATFSSIERLEFENGGTATILVSQLAFLPIIAGSASVDNLTVNIGNATVVDLQSFVPQNWTSGVDIITINGSIGVDNLFGTATFDDVINGGGGDDYIAGSGGQDTLNGGDGSDTFVYFESYIAPSEVINGGGGGTNVDVVAPHGNIDFRQAAISSVEKVDFSAVNHYNYYSANTAWFNALQIGNSALSNTLSVVGSTRSDSFVIDSNAPGGTFDLSGFTFTNWNAAQDVFSITLSAPSFAQNLIGTTQNDKITVVGDWGNNLNGGGGDDTLYGGNGAATLNGGTNGATGDTVDYTGYVTASGTGVVATLQAGGSGTGVTILGNDTFVGIENLRGSYRNDQLTGNDASNRINGDAGSDNLIGMGGDDTLVGYGNDSPGFFGDTLDGGTNGILGDTADFSEAYNFINVTLDASGNGIANQYYINHTLIGIENIIGGSSNDTLNGNASANAFAGGNGADSLSGNGGDDTLDGGAGIDSLNGGTGDDKIFYDAADNLAQVLGGADTDTLIILGGAAPTSFNLTTHEFERAELRISDPGANAWTSYVNNYDSAWRLTHQTGLMDSGQTYFEDYDELGTETWVRITYWNDSLARPDVETGQLDDGRVYDSDIDNGNLYTWTRIDYWRDALGRSDVETGYLDDGRTYNSDLDNGDAFVWLRIDNWADSLARLDYQNGFYDLDDATRPGWTWQVDYDQANEFAWTRVERFWNAAGVLQSETFF